MIGFEEHDDGCGGATSSSTVTGAVLAPPTVHSVLFATVCLDAQCPLRNTMDLHVEPSYLCLSPSPPPPNRNLPEATPCLDQDGSNVEAACHDKEPWLKGQRAH